MKTRMIAKLKTFRVPARASSANRNEYGRTGKGIALCASCGNVYHHKEWHGRGDRALAQAQKVGQLVTQTLCPACSLIGNRLFEGELLLRNLPQTIEKEVLRLVRGFGKRAMFRDPQHRIIAIEHLKGVWRITTTENQLAIRLAKKIRDTFKRAAVTISHSREPFEVGRVHLNFS